jgi:hypothetical protein
VVASARIAQARTRGRMCAVRRTTVGDLRGDDTEGVCPYVVGSGVLDRGDGTGQGHVACMGVPTHGAYVARGYRVGG